MRLSRRALAAAIAVAAAAPGALLAQQAWPARPIKLIVPFPPGGTGDILGRLAAREMEAALGQPVVVENKAGAGGMIGSDAVAKAPADGYTLGVSNIASHAIGPAIYPKMPYDAVKDFTHIGLVAAVPSGIAVAANGPYKTMADLLAKARTAPGAVRFGSNGNGTSSHVKLVLLNRAAKVDITHVPYKGAAPATADVIAGQVDGLIAAVPDVGRNSALRLLAITTEKRAERWPDVPSARELGLAPVIASNWFGISGPAGIPADIADKLNGALVRALNTPALAERLRDLGTEPNKLNRAEYTTLVTSDVARWAEVARTSNIKVD